MKDFSRVLMVVNPVSGGKNKDPLLEEVKQVLKEKDLDFEIFMTSGEGDKKLLQKKIATYAPHRIFSIGGDGTIKLIVELLKDNSIPIAVFPAGSANGLAENLDLPSNPTSLAKIALGNKFAHLDTILINAELCLHISDIGLNAALIKNYHEGKIRGKLGYLIQSIPTLIQSEFPFQFRIETTRGIVERKAVLNCHCKRQEIRYRGNHKSQWFVYDGKFEILIFKKFDIPQILQTFRENVHFNEDFLEIISTEEARIFSEKNIPFQVDGEYRGEVTDIRARISPVKVKITIP